MVFVTEITEISELHHLGARTWLRDVRCSGSVTPCHMHTGVHLKANTVGPLELKLPQLPVGYISRSGASKSPHQVWKFLLLYFLTNSPIHLNCSMQYTPYLQLCT